MNDAFQPVDAALVPRFAGPPTFMRLPAVTSAEGLDIALVGIPCPASALLRQIG